MVVKAPSSVGSEVADLLVAIARVNTTNPTGDEQGCLEVLGQYLSDHGIPVKITEYTQHPAHANLVATFDSGRPGPTLLLNSHVDVVPAGGGWAHPPFTPTLVDDVLFGRGVADAKGCLAAMAVALVSLVDASLLEGGTVVYSAVGDEEVGSSGARHLLPSLAVDACIVGEPTGLQVLNAHKGSVRPVVRIQGLPAHAATPERGRNAIDGAAELLRRTSDLQRRLRERDADNPHGAASLTPVLVEGGEAPNAVPESCLLTFDRRLLPGETAQSALAQLGDVLEGFTADADGLTATIDHLAPSTGGASLTPPEEAIVVAAQRVEQRMGLDDVLGCLQVNCDMASFSQAGIPTIILGPGELEVMHAIDEHIVLTQLETAVDLYRGIILEYFRTAGRA